MPLSKLILRNFQAHKKLDIPLDPHVTTIVGPSDVGKSSIIRALRWVTSNRPNGSSFIRTGSEKASVALFLGKSKAVVRQRGSSRGNVYRMLLNGKEQAYKAFGSAVPTAISDLLKISDINFQEQHDAPFWFSLSDGEVSKRLNEVVNLALIDSVMASIAKKVRTAKERVEVHKELLRDAKRKKQELADAPEFCRELEVVKSAFEEWQRLYQELGQLRTSVQELEKAKKVAAEPAPDMSAVDHARETYLAANNEAEVLYALIDLIEKSKKDSERAYTELKQSEREFHKHVKGKPCPLCQNLM